MPNWIEGSLKLRGRSENLKRFFTEMFQPSAGVGVETSCFVKCRHDAWIKGTQRAFVNGDCWVDFDDFDDFDNDDVKHAICLPIRQAWAFDAESWRDISAEYGIDIRLYGIERGMQFCQEVEIIDGKLISDRKIEYEDWEWECPLPFMGG